jgi:hypothetical protein
MYDIHLSTIDEIADRLYLGNVFQARHLELLNKYKITHILSVGNFSIKYKSYDNEGRNTAI